MAAPAFTVRLAVADDLPQVLEIANHWIANSSANFDEHPYTIEYKSSWFAALDPCLVACAVDSNRILGYAYYSSYLPTPSYSHTVETTIYLSPESTGMGVGTVLYQALIETARRRGKHCMLAALTCGNTASERLHHKLGFKKIGMLPESGIKRGVWYGIEYFQLLLQPAADVPPVSLSPALPPIPIKSSPEFRVREANVSHIDSFMHRFGPTFVKQEFCAESELCDFVRQLVETNSLLIATTTASSLIESEILGFCFHIRYRAKHAYDWTIKSRGFVLPEARGCGVGTALYTAFIQKQKSHGMHSIVAVCNTNNSAAIALHRKVGFEVMGVVSQIARVDEQWQDCVYFYHMLQSGSL